MTIIINIVKTLVLNMGQNEVKMDDSVTICLIKYLQLKYNIGCCFYNN